MASNDYLGQVAIPEGTAGVYSVKHFTHPANKPLDTSNARTAIMGGQRNVPVVYPHATTWHQLAYNKGVWMTDLPIEQAQHRIALAPMQGHILVGGLGLGLAANWLAQRPTTQSVTVVEISEEVIQLVAPHVRDPRGIVSVVHADLFDYLKGPQAPLRDTKGLCPPKQPFDWAFFDVWQSDGEGTFFNTVCPLRKATAPYLPDSRVVCWNEDVMRGQLYHSLFGRYHALTMGDWPGKQPLAKLAHPANKADVWVQWAAPFFQAVECGLVTDTNMQQLAAAYAANYGLHNWRLQWAKAIKAVQHA